MTERNVTPFLVAGILILILQTSPPLLAQMDTELAPETLKAFQKYVQSAESVLQKRNKGEEPFLWIDDDPRQRVKIRQGDIVVHQFEGDTIEVPGGLIHDWIGAMFVPNTTLGETVAFLTDFDRHKDVYPEVVEAKLIEEDGDTVRSSMRTTKKKVLTVVLDMELEAHHQKLSGDRYTIRTYSTKVSEVIDAGTSNEESLPDGQGTGFLWRLYSYWKIEQVDDGVFAELETVSLTRAIPRGLGFVIKPFIKSVPEESLTSTLQATRLALTQP
jgi:hypothetical protein